MSGAGPAARLLALLAVAAGAGPAAAFVRGTTCSDPQSGYALWWPAGSATLRLSSERTPSGCADLATADALAAQSFLTWNGASRAGAAAPCTDFAFVHGATTSTFAVGAADGQNVIAFRKGPCSELVPPGSPCLTRGGCANLFDCWESGDATHSQSTLAITWITFDTASGRISDADIELNDWDGIHAGSSGGFLFTCAAPGSPPCSGNGDPRAVSPGCIYIDLGSVVLHESGHVLGLDHPCPSNQDTCGAVMQPYISPGITYRELQPDDVDGVCSIYPLGRPIWQQKLPGSCVESRGCGCDGGPASAPWALLPILLLPRRGRRRR